MALRDRKSDGLVLRCIMGAYCIYCVWHKMVHHCCDCLNSLYFISGGGSLHVASIFVCFVSLRLDSLMQNKWLITQKVFPGFSLQFSCALCGAAYKPSWPFFKYGEKINVCSPLLLYFQVKQSKTSNCLHHNYTCILTVKKYSSHCPM